MNDEYYLDYEGLKHYYTKLKESGIITPEPLKETSTIRITTTESSLLGRPVSVTNGDVTYDVEFPMVFDTEGKAIVEVLVEQVGIYTVESSSAEGEETIEAIEVLTFYSVVDVSLMLLDPTKMELTQDEFLKIIEKRLVDQMSQGAIITLNNQYCSTYQVIDVNHDETFGTVDIMPTTQVGNMIFSSSNNIYETSSIRIWINGTYLQAFDTDLQNNATTMLVKTATSLTAGTVLADKVKLLSAVEMNYTTFHQNMPGYSTYKEGKPYPIFTADEFSAHVGNRWRPAGQYGSTATYFLRTPYLNTNRPWGINKTGTGYLNIAENTNSGVLPVMRFENKAYTQEEFINMINNQQYEKFNIGDKIILNNEYCSVYEIIGKNHDGTTNTIDVMANTQVGTMGYGASTWAASSVRTWLNNQYLLAFDEAVTALTKSMEVKYATSSNSGDISSDKVKLLSAVEMNLTSFAPSLWGYPSFIEGEAYEIFEPGAYNAQIASRWRDKGSKGYTSYWLRSRSYTSSYPNNVFFVNNYGLTENSWAYTMTCGILPVLRF